MRIFSALFCAASVIAAVAGAPPAHALTMKECSAKYQAAQQAGTLNGMKWNDFRKTECGAAGPAAAAAPASGGKPANPAAPVSASGGKSANPASPAKETQAPAGNAVFPPAVSPKYSSESAGKARMHTCLDQYNANKANNANGGLHWIQKGGGYYSVCNNRLKG